MMDKNPFKRAQLANGKTGKPYFSGILETQFETLKPFLASILTFREDIMNVV
jgi:hypothetical protein